MARLLLLLSFFKQTTLSFSFILRTWIFSLLFLAISMVLVNIINFISIGLSDYSIGAKFKIFSALFYGAFETVSAVDLTAILIISILFGVNLSLIAEKYKFIRKQPNLKITLGTGIISLAAAGCASCGLSVASLVGLGTALAALPFGGIELYVFSIVVLILSLYYNLTSLYNACKI